MAGNHSVKALSLFSGAGGFDIGFERAGIETVAFAENDPRCSEVLGHRWPGVPNLGDVCRIQREAGDIAGEPLESTTRRSSTDIIHGGFPCQDLSVAGKRAGLGGERSNLWFEFQRILSQLRPRWCVIENVPGLLSSNGGRDFAYLLESLGECGFDGIAWCILDAQNFGVPQRRRRVFIVGGPSRSAVEAILSICEGCGGNPETGEETREGIAGTLGGGSKAGERGYRNDLDGQGAFIPVAGTLGGGHGDREQPIDGHGAYWVAQPLRANRWGGSDSHGDEGNVVAYALDTKLGDKQWLEDQGVRNWEIMDRAGAGVRRLTPLECERLMGWPDDWTRWDSQGNEIADSHRYRMCGNGVVATVAEWIGRRIVAIENPSNAA